MCAARLQEQWINYRKNPLFGFKAKPSKNPDGTLNLFQWDSEIPGTEGTIWAEGVYKMKIIFDDNYPSTPPICRFCPPVFHPNVFPSGNICATFLTADNGWDAGYTIQEILLGVQNLLNEPNFGAPAQVEAFAYNQISPELYKLKVLYQARCMRDQQHHPQVKMNDF